MNLDNRTVYDTKTIRRLISATYEHLAVREGRLPRWCATTRGSWPGGPIPTRGTIIKVVYSRGAHVSGCAAYNGVSMTLRFPKPEKRRVILGRVVWLIYHELMHLYGYRHRQYKNIPFEETVKVLIYAAVGTMNDLLPLRAESP